MINLKTYQEYWEGFPDRISRLAKAMPITIDEEISRRLLAIRKGDHTLFFLPPGAESEAKNSDAWRETNICVVFVMEKYDPQRMTSYEVLTDTQTTIEALKRILLEDLSAGCCPMRIDAGSINTLPETKFFGNFAGWSVGFNVKSE
ncbi:MAG: hypothetical protein HDS25_00940 [Bacteroides sp.]|nr:hypothetical protein [Bacteroides sp.]